MYKRLKLTTSADATPRTACGVRFSLYRSNPGCRKRRSTPGLISNHASGVRMPHAEGVTGNKPRVERFLRHPGLERTARKNAPRKACKDYFGQRCLRGDDAPIN